MKKLWYMYVGRYVSLSRLPAECLGASKFADFLKQVLLVEREFIVEGRVRVSGR